MVTIVLISNYCLEILRTMLILLHTNSKLKEAALSSYNEHNKSPNKYSNLSKEEFHALSILSKNETLIIQKSDRGNAIVILIGLTI